MSIALETKPQALPGVPRVPSPAALWGSWTCGFVAQNVSSGWDYNRPYGIGEGTRPPDPPLKLGGLPLTRRTPSHFLFLVI